MVLGSEVLRVLFVLARTQLISALEPHSTGVDPLALNPDTSRVYYSLARKQYHGWKRYPQFLA